MSVTTIEQHHQKWSELPLFTPTQWVVTDEDITAWSDILYMRTLVDEIEDYVGPDPDDLHDVEPARGSIEFDVDLYLEPWPSDYAADQLVAWKLNTCVDGVLDTLIAAVTA